MSFDVPFSIIVIIIIKKTPDQSEVEPYFKSVGFSKKSFLSNWFFITWKLKFLKCHDFQKLKLKCRKCFKIFFKISTFFLVSYTHFIKLVCPFWWKNSIKNVKEMNSSVILIFASVAFSKMISRCIHSVCVICKHDS